MPERRETKRDGRRNRRHDSSRDRTTIRLDQPRTPRRGVLPHPSYTPETFGRLAERIARFLGTAKFLAYMTVFILVWVAWNVFGPPDTRFDGYPFTFLILMLSVQASYSAPLILLAQNRQTDRDRISLEEDRTRALAGKADTEYLARELAALRIAMGEVATRDFIRSELARKSDEDHDRDRTREREDGRSGA